MHAHDHADERNTYYLDQLCTIGVCGALGVVMILLKVNDVLSVILVPKFHLPVFYGGIALLALVAVRAVAVWVASGQEAKAHTHSHEDEACHAPGHGHAHPACEHHHEHAHAHAHTHAHDDHGHDHGWAPWRYAVLLLPVVLYFMNIPAAPGAEPEDPVEPGVTSIEFKEAESAAYTEDARQRWEGQLVRLKGQFVPSSSDGRVFSLRREKISCCAADRVELKIKIISPKDLPAGELNMQWVKVIGTIQFRQNHRGQFVTEVHVRENQEEVPDVTVIPPDPTPFIF